jgi:hypothetical protein
MEIPLHVQMQIVPGPLDIFRPTVGDCVLYNVYAPAHAKFLRICLVNFDGFDAEIEPAGNFFVAGTPSDHSQISVSRSVIGGPSKNAGLNSANLRGCHASWSVGSIFVPPVCSTHFLIDENACSSTPSKSVGGTLTNPQPRFRLLPTRTLTSSLWPSLKILISYLPPHSSEIST